MAPKKSQETINKRLHNSKQRKGADILDHEFQIPALYQRSTYPPTSSIHLQSILSNKNQSTEKAPQTAKGEKDKIAVRKELLVNRVRHGDRCKHQMDESQSKTNRSPNILLTPTTDSRKGSVLRKPLSLTPPPAASTPLSWQQFINHTSQLPSLNRHFPSFYRTPPTSRFQMSPGSPKSPKSPRSPRLDKISMFRSAWTPLQTDEDENEDRNALNMPTEIEETLRKLDNFIKQIKTQRSCLGAHFLMKDDELNIHRTDEVPSKEVQAAPSWEFKETSCPKVNRYFQEQRKFHPTRLAEVHSTPLVGKRPCTTVVTPRTSTTRNRSGFVLAPATANKKKRIPKSVWED